MDSELRRVVKPDGFRVAWVEGVVTRFLPGMISEREKAISKAKGLVGGRVRESIAYAVFGERLVEVQRFNNRKGK